MKIIYRTLLSRTPLLYALLDQAFISALNFLVIYLLSKWTVQEVFFVFVIFQSAGLLLVTLSQSFAAQPLLTLRQRYRDKGAGSLYDCSVLVFNGALILTAALLAGVLLSLAYSTSFVAMGSLMFYALGWTTYEIVRRIQYAEERPRTSAVASLVLLCSAIVLLYLLHSSLAAILLSLGGAYLLIALVEVGAWRIGVLLRSGLVKSLAFATGANGKSIVAQHWHYGKWVAPGSASFWVTSQAYLFLASGYLAASDVSGLRTSQNIAGVLTILLVAAENHLTPRYANIVNTEGVFCLQSWVKRHQHHMVLASLAMIIAGAPVIFFASQVLYPELGTTAHVLAVLFFVGFALQFANRGYVCGLRAMGITKPFAIAQILAAVTTLALAFLALPFFGVLGGPVVFMIATLVFFAVIRHYYLKSIRSGLEAT